MKQALPQRCRLDGLCKEAKMCSPTLRICERNSLNSAIFELIEKALNDENHPLHEKAICSYNFVDIPALVPTSEIVAIQAAKRNNS